MHEFSDIFKAQKEQSRILSESTFVERLEKLKKLKAVILSHRQEIKAALFADFKKPFEESELTEIHTSLDEINVSIRNLKKWMKPKKVGTPISLFGAKSYIHYQARGVVLILAPWNYPFSMVIHPLIAAMSAGNAVIIKPSEKTQNVAMLLEKMLAQAFKQNEVAVFNGDAEVSKALLELPFDHIFFTGSEAVGKYVMEKASKHLTPVTLELGGKSPVVIDQHVNLEDATKKIVWAKFLNAGQTCVAPDYCFVHESLKESFFKIAKSEIALRFGENENEQKQSKSFARMIDQNAYERMTRILKDSQLDSELNSERFIAPTLIKDAKLDSLAMKEEIFGPILPVLYYKDLNEVIAYINDNPRPLALYFFSNHSKNIEKMLTQTTSGGVGINHLILHLANPNLPFGGVGRSGMGSYHGHFGFKTFSHEKAVLKQGAFTLTHLYFQPYVGKISNFAYKILKVLE